MTRPDADPGLRAPRNRTARDTTRMRPHVAFAFLVAGLFCLILAVWPFATEHRLVGLGGVIVFGLLYLGERRRTTPPR
jgi:hypothetical protein